MIEARSLTRRFGAVTALDEFTCRIPPGMVGFLGPNGAGKSTFLKLMLGLLQPTGGGVTVLGHRVDDDAVGIRRRIGYMPEHDCLARDRTGVDFLIEMGQLSGLSRQHATQRAHEVLHYLRMGEERYRPIRTYSGGMRQKVKLAQALVHGPELVLLDEPTTGLDPHARADMLSTISGLAALGHTNVLFCTHILHDVEKVCEQVLIIADGRLKLMASVADLLQQSSFVQVQAGEPVEAFIAALQARRVRAEKRGATVRVAWSGEETYDQVIAAAAESGTPLYYIDHGTNSLEEKYLEVMG